jgi:hypothetical protein
VVRDFLVRNGLMQWDVLKVFCLLYFAGIPLALQRQLAEVRTAAASRK